MKKKWLRRWYNRAKESFLSILGQRKKMQALSSGGKWSVRMAVSIKSVLLPTGTVWQR